MTPPDHNGPFVTDHRGPGLLRRLFGGGTHDPTAPHTHDEASTSEMHDRAPRRTPNPTPVAPTTLFGTPRAPSAPRTSSASGDATTSGAGRGIVATMFLWILRRMGVRLVIAAVAGILILIGSFNDGTNEVDQVSRGLQEIQDDFAGGTFSAEDPATAEPMPAAPISAPRGSYRVTVDRQEAGSVVLSDPTGSTFTWEVATPELTGMLARNMGEEVLVYWEDRGGEIFVVGVSGPNGSIAPIADA